MEKLYPGGGDAGAVLVGVELGEVARTLGVVGQILCAGQRGGVHL